MILQCPSCDARFMAPDLAIGEEGRRVRCGRCRFIWFATAAAPEEEMPESSAALSEGPSLSATAASGQASYMRLPAIKPKPPLALRIAACVLFAVLLGVSAMNFMPQTFGFALSEGMKLEDVIVRRQNSPHDGERFGEGMAAYTVEGKIRNATADVMRVPNLRFSLLDLQGSLQKSWQVSRKSGLIAPGETMPFTTEPLEVPKDQMGHLMVEVGSWLEFKRRGPAQLP